MKKAIKYIVLSIFVILLCGGVIAFGLSYFLVKNQYKEISNFVDSAEIVDKNLDLKDKVSFVLEKNNEYKNLIKDSPLARYGVIKGETSTVFSTNGSVLDEQMVCAESTSNEDNVVCIKVVGEVYELSLKKGEYYVYSEIINTELKPSSVQKAYYTQYISCKASESAECTDDLKSKKQRVEVKEGEVVEGVNPRGWVF